MTEIEKEMLREPGIYSGDQYDEDKVNEALDQLPENLTAEQYLESVDNGYKEYKNYVDEGYEKIQETNKKMHQ
ncbi:Uncharacterised protein [Bacillus freudenreichii]|nr:Uncharacterised protein [Bacillus freudenreichii]